MDVIITAIGELVWAASCTVVNFCLTSGLSVLVVFVSFLCAILASAFYKYTTSREQMSLDDATCTLVDQDNNDLDKPITETSTTEPLVTPLLLVTTPDESNNTNSIDSLEEIEIRIEETTDEIGTVHEETTEKNEIDHGETTEENETDYEETSNDMLIDTIEGSEEEIQKKQIANIYRLLNDQHLTNNWSTTDFLDQLKMYGLQTYDENELELS